MSLSAQMFTGPDDCYCQCCGFQWKQKSCCLDGNIFDDVCPCCKRYAHFYFEKPSDETIAKYALEASKAKIGCLPVIVMSFGLVGGATFVLGRFLC